MKPDDCFYYEWKGIERKMKIENEEIYNKSFSILKDLYGESASFRDGQYEAIEATMTQNRTLVVQRTGWGKSLVYFIETL